MWPGGAPCGEPAVEVLHYCNAWMDAPGPPGLALCTGHLREYMAEHLLL